VPAFRHNIGITYRKINQGAMYNGEDVTEATYARGRRMGATYQGGGAPDVAIIPAPATQQGDILIGNFLGMYLCVRRQRWTVEIKHLAAYRASC
jgi:hypothetical protein